MALDTLDNTAIERGLDIENHPAKWKQAKKLAFQTDRRDFREDELCAFEVACRLFLELGGNKVKPSIDKILQDILRNLLSTANLTTGAVGINKGFASIELTSVVTENNIRALFRKYGAELNSESMTAENLFPWH